jgi:hypothetical protein
VDFILCRGVASQQRANVANQLADASENRLHEPRWHFQYLDYDFFNQIATSEPGF